MAFTIGKLGMVFLALSYQHEISTSHPNCTQLYLGNLVDFVDFSFDDNPDTFARSKVPQQGCSHPETAQVPFEITHVGNMSDMSERSPSHHCLVPDLPQVFNF